MRAGIGHNQGPSLDKGTLWRTYLWKRARAKAMPKTIPLMVVKMHVARARQLGLDYPTYAALRKATGRDIMGLLFSSNALQVVRAETPRIPLARGEKLAAVQDAKCLALVHLPLAPTAILAANPMLAGAGPAPRFTDSWSEMHDYLGRFVTDRKLLRDQVLVIGETAFERDWAAAGRSAGYLEGARYFAT
ncbi:MAG: hypothetical protein P1U53_09445 [Sulfitobacter sp.]|nr:hypothetical protein [Sulfitobacter sp.]